MTRADITKQVLLMVKKYHSEVHSSLGVTPLEMYKSYLLAPRGQESDSRMLGKMDQIYGVHGIHTCNGPCSNTAFELIILILWR